LESDDSSFGDSPQEKQTVVGRFGASYPSSIVCVHSTEFGAVASGLSSFVGFGLLSADAMVGVLSVWKKMMNVAQLMN
jgi:hypothetical protein